MLNLHLDVLHAEVFPKCSPQKHLKPYWSEMIQPHKDCCLFWNSIWVDSGAPRIGIIAEIFGILAIIFARFGFFLIYRAFFYMFWNIDLKLAIYI